MKYGNVLIGSILGIVFMIATIKLFVEGNIFASIFVGIATAYTFVLVGAEIGDQISKKKYWGKPKQITDMEDGEYSVMREPLYLRDERGEILSSVRAILCGGPESYGVGKETYAEITKDDLPSEILSKITTFTSIIVENGKVKIE